jgi:hypothetical protein
MRLRINNLATIVSRKKWQNLGGEVTEHFRLQVL